MRKTVRFPDDVHRRAKEAARRCGMTLSQFVTEALVTKLAVDKSHKAPLRLQFQPRANALKQISVSRDEP